MIRFILLAMIAILFTGCTRDESVTPLATPPTPAQTKAAADLASAKNATAADEKVGQIKTTADADRQIAELSAEISALKGLISEKTSAIADLKVERATIIQNNEAFIAHLIAGALALAAVAFGVLWYFAPVGLKSLDSKLALAAGAGATVLYFAAAYIGDLKWVGAALCAGLVGYRLYHGHVLQNAFATLVKDGHVVLNAVTRAGWVQAVVDKFHAVAVKLHLENKAADSVAQTAPKV
jgi:hypothetical protein